MCPKSLTLLLQMHLLLPLAKGHLSNVTTISWQIGWPYQRGSTVLVFLMFFNFLRNAQTSQFLRLWCDTVGDPTPAYRTPSGCPNHYATRGRSLATLERWPLVRRRTTSKCMHSSAHKYFGQHKGSVHCRHCQQKEDPNYCYTTKVTLLKDTL